jgi:pheromone receptor transcription factor
MYVSYNNIPRFLPGIMKKVSFFFFTTFSILITHSYIIYSNKAYELSTLTGTQVLLLVVSETGLVYTFTTAKLQPLVTQPEGKNLIQACLNAPHGQLPSTMPVGTPIGRSAAGSATGGGAGAGANVPGGLAIDESDDAGKSDDQQDEPQGKRRKRAESSAAQAAVRSPPTAPAPITQQQQQPSQAPSAPQQQQQPVPMPSPSTQPMQPPQQPQQPPAFQPQSYAQHHQQDPSGQSMYPHMMQQAGYYTGPPNQQHPIPWGTGPVQGQGYRR